MTMTSQSVSSESRDGIAGGHGDSHAVGSGVIASTSNGNIASQPSSSTSAIQAALDDVQYGNQQPQQQQQQHLQQQQPEASTSKNSINIEQHNNSSLSRSQSTSSHRSVAVPVPIAAADNATMVPTTSTSADSGAAVLNQEVKEEDKDNSQEKLEQREEEVDRNGQQNVVDPVQEIKLDLLLLSGSRKRFTFKPTTTITEVLAWVYKDWPSEWQEQKPTELGQLRLLHRGQFLQGPTTLASHNLESGESTVMHLNIKPSETSDNLKPKRTKTPSQKATDDRHGGGCCSGCVIS